VSRELSTRFGQRSKVHAVGDAQQQVGVFRIRLVAHE
jgi:hypothetical protein